MKALVYEEHGGPEVIQYLDVADPQPGPGEVVIQVEAVSVNPGPDVVTRQGGFGVPGFSLPHVGGIDAAGVVVDAAPDVVDVAVGDRVAVYPLSTCGTCEFCREGRGENYCVAWRLWGVHSWGGRSELAAVSAANLIPLPDQVSAEQAAALGVAYVTTWHGIVDRAGLNEEDTVLVVGAAGGCGVAAIQIARHFGARALAVSGTEEKRRRAIELGAEAAFDYNREGWGEEVLEFTEGRGASIVFDNAGESTWPQSLPCLRRAGRFVCSGGTTGTKLDIDIRWAYRNLITMHFYMNGSRENLEQLIALVAAGAIEPVVDSCFPFSEVAVAEAKLASHDHFGKIILVPDGRDV